jgi:hypothetical protein
MPPFRTESDPTILGVDIDAPLLPLGLALAALHLVQHRQGNSH